MFTDVQAKKDTKYSQVEATSKMFRTVYAEIRANIPFNQHKVIVELQKTHKINLGTHYSTKEGAMGIVESISRQMHEKLLANLKTEKNPISLIMDTSDDFQKRHYLSVMFQTIEKNRPVVYFYRLIELTSDERGKGLYDALIGALEEDDLLNHIKTNLVGFTSDGM